jgi:hypothetical protein
LDNSFYKLKITFSKFIFFLYGIMPVKHKKQMVKWIGAVKEGYHALAGKKLSRAINNRAVEAVASAPSFAKGGKIRKTGLAKVHKGEIVLNKSAVKAMKKCFA